MPLSELHLLETKARVKYRANSFNPFSTNVPLLYPLETSGFLMFSGRIEVEHWLKMG